MRKLWVCILLAAMFLASACSQEETGKQEDMVYVKGGTFKSSGSNYTETSMTLSDFYIGKYEVTQAEWANVMGGNPSAFKSDQLPVEMVSWYDAVEYCNKRSIQEGLKPFYNIDKDHKDPNNINENDQIKWTVTVNQGANGYRLPTEAEWEYAASGGLEGKGFKYSGSNKAEDVAWYWRNAGDKYLSGDWNWPVIESNHNRTKPVGTRKSNELGLYDMSGNVREWCWDWYGDGTVRQGGSFRVVKGGGWIGDISNTEVSFRGKFDPNGYGPDQGFRVVRGK
ncbi:formylglycine-generating enzyme family protein [Paenibacillus sp. PSB04]|uniref:formylglycine-generating enzyme family protein n=1 Tax=Paenibacillus sp. PSB04 TaxID=2866810 RepID=UPI0021F0F0E8|nr:formylglycine-generating enzyme family protein [Paenibacillus sp. PSB04]UYO02231.1 formylglycine-generating enzyme family protein [Paenibacillus sp. PSB04]